jgi:DNA-binding NarL/FixJ family response regulator
MAEHTAAAQGPDAQGISVQGHEAGGQRLPMLLSDVRRLELAFEAEHAALDIVRLERAQAVVRALDGGASYGQVANVLRRSRSTVQDIVRWLAARAPDEAATSEAGDGR